MTVEEMAQFWERCAAEEEKEAAELAEAYGQPGPDRYYAARLQEHRYRARMYRGLADRRRLEALS
jgi:hypothetical protein